MWQHNSKTGVRFTILALVALAFGVGQLLVSFYAGSDKVSAAGPTQNPGTGSGALATDGSGNLSIGATPSSSVKFLIQAPNALSTNYALSVVKQNGAPIIQAGNDGTVLIPGLVGGGLTINANNVSAGQFGANTGNGNFTFPASVGIGTTNIVGALTLSGGTDRMLNFRGDPTSFGLPAGLLGPILQGINSAQTATEPITLFGGANLMGGNVGIGTTAPGAKLDILGGASTSYLNFSAAGATSFGSVATDGANSPTLTLQNPSSFAFFTLNPDTGIIFTGSNAKVGIGTATPGQKLSVVGTIESTSGGFKFPDGTTQVTAAAGAALPHFQTFTSSGTWTWPAGVGMVWVTMCGGGGGGGDNLGGGGGAGICYFHFPVAVGGSVSVTVGAGGAGGATANANGVAGGNTSFGALTAAGGTGGGGGAGRGGVAGGSDVLTAASYAGYFVPPRAGSSGGGPGGITRYGGGGGGGYAGVGGDGGTGTVGGDGTGYGSGGGGGANGGTFAGGAGTSGIVIVEWMQ